MGQYFTCILKKGNEPWSRVENELANGDFIGAKLMEHSYEGNRFMGAICKLLYHNPHEVAWLGDYADVDVECTQELYDLAHKDETKENGVVLDGEDFPFIERILINHTKQCVLNLDSYFKCSTKSQWVAHPLSLLTAVGNGRGGGDYFGLNEALVGTWAFDILSTGDIADWPNGYEEAKGVAFESPV